MNVQRFCDIFAKFSARRYEKENISEEQLISDNYVQPRDWVKSLEKFISSKEDPDYFIRYSGVPSLTINPKFEKANILGIYAFPFTNSAYDKLASNNLDAIFEDAEYVLILKPKNKDKILNTFNYSLEQFVADMNNFKQSFEELSVEGKNIFDSIVLNIGKEFSNPRFFLFFLEKLKSQLPKEDSKKLLGDKVYNLSKLFTSIGYEGLYNGIEAVFFSATYLEDPIIFNLSK